MFEINLTAYTGIEKEKTYKYGVQITNPKNMTNKLEYYGNGFNLPQWSYYINATHVIDFTNCNVTYFNSDTEVASNTDVSYIATTTLNANNIPYVIDIEEQTYAFDFNKNYLGKTHVDALGVTNHYYYQSNFEYFVFKLYSSMSTLSEGQKVYDNLNVQLNDVFNIYEHNSLTGKFDKLTTFGYSAEYIGLKITYVERGARIHEDSMFNRIGDSQKGGVIYG